MFGIGSLRLGSAATGKNSLKNVVRVSLTIVATLLPAACATGHTNSTGPQITPLNAPPPRNASTKPINLRGTVIDASTQRPVQLAHVSYDHRVVSSDANGSFALTGVPANQPLMVVAAGYKRYSAVWNPSKSQVALTPF
jgi:hypothetical protein